MKIRALETLQLPEYGNILWCRLHTDDGIVGLGETFRGADAVATYLHTLVAPQILGEDPRSIEALSTRLLSPYIGHRSSGVEVRAASCVDIALWDLAGKRQGQPVYQALGGACRPAIRTYNTCAGYAYNLQGRGRRAISDSDQTDARPYDDQIAFNRDAGALAKSLLDQGITAMKIWPFDVFAVASGGNFIHHTDLEKGLEPFQRIRDAVGDRMEIMVEMHSMWDLPSALAIAKALRPYRPFWLEDPIRMSNPQALASFSRKAGVPVCASETLATRFQFLDILNADATDYVMFDLSWCGGITEARKIANLADAFQRPAAPHDCTGPITFLSSIHLSMHLSNAVFQESVRAYYTSWYRDLVTCLPRIHDGMIEAPEGPGLGAELSDQVLNHPDLIRRVTELPA